MHVDPIVFLAHVLRVATELNNWEETERMIQVGIADPDLKEEALWTVTEMKLQHTTLAEQVKAA